MNAEDWLKQIPTGQLSDYFVTLQRIIGSRAIGLTPDELKLLPAEELEGRIAEARAELERRQARPEPEPEPEVLEGWRLATVEPGTARGTWDVAVSDGEHTVRFVALSSQPGLAWFVEQIAAMGPTGLGLNCEHCPDTGEPTRPAFWDEESD